MRTIVSVLCSSVGCEAVTARNRRVLRVGSSIPRSHCFKLLETSDDLIEKLEGRREFYFCNVYIKNFNCLVILYRSSQLRDSWLYDIFSCYS